MHRFVVAFPAGEDEARVPPECLTEMGIAPGTRLILEASPGRLLLTPFWDAPAVRSDLGAIARDLEDLRGRLQQVARRLPEPALSTAPTAATAATAATAEPSPTLAEVGADLVGTLECILADDVEPALAKLQEAVAVTLGRV